ncbi:hypothetical protein BBK82_01240 [Lentzea guizhouensis]|uniref:Uncharacterized protein n=1 Tax=Lentzea guizhouensis TaxID=1586287 RepID=A0A1B2HB13_9PSEU|nr:hypothetical protein BBK82_01240 [Lentzea guizhouensis]
MVPSSAGSQVSGADQSNFVADDLDAGFAAVPSSWVTRRPVLPVAPSTRTVDGVVALNIDMTRANQH